MKAVFRWLGRKAILYLLLVLALAFFVWLWPTIKTELSGSTVRTELMSPTQIINQLQTARVETQNRLKTNVDSLRNANDARLAQRLAIAKSALEAAKRQRQQSGGLLDHIRPTKILEQRLLDLRITELELEIAGLNHLRKEQSTRSALEAAREKAGRLSYFPPQPVVDRARAECQAATDALRKFDERWAADRIIRDLFRGERAKLVRTRREECGEAQSLDQRRTAGLQAARNFRDAQLRYDAARDWAVGEVNDVSKSVPASLIRNILKWAALALASIIAMPLLIRLFFYFVLAPLAERRPAIRLPVAHTTTTPTPLTGNSQTSISVTLREGEEFLVRQGFLQATSETGSKQTRWLLDWHHPLSSIASGMTFLTRVTGTGSRTTVSAVRDPLAEVTLLELPAGSSCVLHPRTLAAVIQPIGRPMRITRHWRLASLHAWLTLQLRYLVFHGPARLIIKGSRGVQVEAAERGRIFGQAQLVGFSANLAYSVRRTETFWPYFFGREQLLKDRVLDGHGVLIVEEAPLAGERPGQIKRGLEGVVDAGLKAFGL